MAPKFDQDSVKDYTFTHGKAPKGIGGWLFGLGRNGSWTEISYFGTFTEAKKQAMREARALGCDTVTVQP
jgi:hypothetical protein